MLQVLKRPPPPIIVLLLAFFMWGVALLEPAYGISLLVRYSLFCVVVFIAICIGVLGIVECKQAGTTISPMTPENTQVLVTKGIYKYSRNPMYLGLALCLIGWAIFLSSFLSTLGVIFFVNYMNQCQICHEEKALVEKFNGTFLDYKNTVRKWI